MMNTWAGPSPFQARGEGINPGFWIVGPVAFRASACSPWARRLDGQPAQLQTGLSGEAL
jgi:hypothetical protein